MHKLGCSENILGGLSAFQPQLPGLQCAAACLSTLPSHSLHGLGWGVVDKVERFEHADLHLPFYQRGVHAEL